MSRKYRNELRSDSADYRSGYADGMRAAFEESELDAYYAGVGYGKKASGDKHIGFNNAKEYEQFQNGIDNKDKHFRGYRMEKRSFLEKILFKSENRKRHRKEKRKTKLLNSKTKRIKGRTYKRRSNNSNKKR